ncbi:MAG: phosphatidylserine decarboxylase [Candidatus Marinimicrobia bacterium TMED108]|nr:MAG: phosphatidylserine decarboxylase [Candidatus Marinimicrobia bacterium TMED108]
MIAKEGRLILCGLLLFLFPFGIYVHASEVKILYYLYFLFGSFYIFTIYFFRDPLRKIPFDTSAILSPADGRVVSINTVNDNDIGESSQVISIFLSIFDVHAFRYPYDGKIKSVNNRNGSFIAAFNHNASEVNEQIVTVIKSNSFTFKIKQIAGLVARRILCYAKPNEVVQKGDRMGFIRFGSRADIVVSSKIKVCVNVGEKVKAGESVIARI